MPSKALLKLALQNSETLRLKIPFCDNKFHGESVKSLIRGLFEVLRVKKSTKDAESPCAIKYLDSNPRSKNAKSTKEETE